MDLKTLALGMLVLNGLIILHELGHFLAARRFGLTVQEFAIGVGPRLFSWTCRGIRYVIRLFPVGGYVLLPDLAPEDDRPAAPIWKRFVSLLAGPLANLALVVLVMGPVSAVRAAGLWLQLIAELVRDVATTGAAAPGSGFVGPLGVSEAVGQAAAMGWQSLLRMTAVLSLNLGLFNLMPVPGLDGGRLVSLLVEWLNGGRRAAWEPVLQGLGLLLFLGLSLWITGREILTYVF